MGNNERLPSIGNVQDLTQTDITLRKVCNYCNGAVGCGQVTIVPMYFILNTDFKVSKEMQRLSFQLLIIMNYKLQVRLCKQDKQLSKTY